MSRAGRVAVVLAVVALPAAAVADDTPPPPTTSATAIELDRAALRRRPREREVDPVRHLGGVYALSPFSGATGFHLLARGWNGAGAGDVQVRVDGIPVNLGSHLFGHAHADTSFVIADTLASVRLDLGPGVGGDFAAGGVLRLDTLDRLPGDGAIVRLAAVSPIIDKTQARRRLRRLGYQLTGMASPALPRGRTLTAVELGVDDGPTLQPERFRRGKLLARWSAGDDDGGIELIATALSQRWNDSGLLPAPALESGDLARDATLDPAQGGALGRASLSARYRATGARERAVELSAYLVATRLRRFANMTAFRRDAVDGDLREHIDDRTTGGIEASYRRPVRLAGMRGHVRFGADARAESIDASTWAAPRQARLDTCDGHDGPCAQAALHVRDVAAHGQLELAPTSAISMRAGGRVDQMTWDVEQLADGVIAPKGIAAKARFSPHAAVAMRLADELRLVARVGGGFRSVDARAAASGGAFRSLPRIWSGELGAHWQVASARAGITTWWSWRDADRLWSPDDASIIEAPAGDRYGIDATAAATFGGWLVFDAAVTVARGDTIALAGPLFLSPRLAATTGLSATSKHSLASVHARALGPRAGLAPGIVPGATLVDLVLERRWRSLTARLVITNLLDADAYEMADVADIAITRDAPVTRSLMLAPTAPRTAILSLVADL